MTEVKIKTAAKKYTKARPIAKARAALSRAGSALHKKSRIRVVKDSGLNPKSAPKSHQEANKALKAQKPAAAKSAPEVKKSTKAVTIPVEAHTVEKSAVKHKVTPTPSGHSGLDYTQLQIPSNIVNKNDIVRLLAELERVDDQMTTESIRSRALDKRVSPRPALSDQLADFLSLNNLKLDDGPTRATLVKQLRRLKDMAPVMHMTFASSADRDSLQKLTKWLRRSMHAQTVIEPGLQPSLVAGVYLRTPNHVYDFSLRKALEGQRPKLVEHLNELAAERSHGR